MSESANLLVLCVAMMASSYFFGDSGVPAGFTTVAFAVLIGCANVCKSIERLKEVIHPNWRNANAEKRSS